MTVTIDVGELAEQSLFAAQELAQFEPDPESGGYDAAGAAAAADASDAQWVVFPDAAVEAAWAATEQLGWPAR